MALKQIGTPLAPGFDAPLEMLAGCHGRILGFCQRLERLLEHLPKQGADGEARAVAAAIAHYFNTAGEYHHQDEEQDLFPMLAERDADMAALIDELTTAHRQLDQAWAALSPLLDRLEQVSVEQLRPVATEFIALNRAHVELENRALLPMAQALLTPADVENLGRAMAKRRKVQYISSASGDMA